MAESKRANTVSIALATGAMILVGAVPAYSASAASSAQDRVSDAVRIVERMKQDPGLARILHEARGVFIVPHYGKAGFIVGGQGGGGVVLAERNGVWSSPAFYDIAGGSVGAQIGGEAGAVAMILMTHRAVRRFAGARSPWSLNGNAGLTVVTWSGKTQAGRTQDDVIMWTDAKGLYGGLTASLTRLSPQTSMDRAYYGRRVTSGAILTGRVRNPSADPLRDALASRVASAQP
jgi:lipid-binding SYLF domain-containing protein